MAAALLAVLAAGCSTPTAGSFRPAAATAHRGGDLRVAITAPGSVDPGNDYEPAGDLVIRTMCDPLLTTDPRDGSLRPGLAESWLVTDGGAKIVLRLRDGLRFSDGSPLTAADVAFSLSRVASAEFASRGADRLALIVGYPVVHGDQPTEDAAARRTLVGVRSADSRTVEITLSRPFAEFARLLADRLTAPVSRQAVERDPRAFARQPVCAGPYRLAGPVDAQQQVIRLVRSAAAQPADPGLTGGGLGYADTVSFHLYPTPAAAAAALLAGEVDLAPARSTDTAGVRSGTGRQVEYLGFPLTTAPFDQVVVRRALSLALSREKLVAEVFPGTRQPAAGFLPATTGQADRCDALPPGGDVPAARELLRRAGIDLRGVRAPLPYNDELRNRELVTAVAGQWQQALGLVAVPTPLSFPAYLAQGAQTQGFAGPFRFSWSGAGVDDYLRPLLATDAIGRDNFSRFSSATFDDVLDRQAAKAVDVADRALAYRRAAGIACTDLPLLPLTTGLSRWLVGPAVGAAGDGWLDRSAGQPLLREVHRL